MKKRKPNRASKKSCQGKKRPVYSTDQLATKTYCCLLRDLRSIHGSSFRCELDKSLLESVGKFRGLEHPCTLGTTAYRFKAHAQAEAYLKKYRFANDVYTDAELKKITLEKFLNDQLEISRTPYKSLKTLMVLQRARKIAKRILGNYSEDEVIHYAKFGEKSSIGCPLASAYIDNKLSDVKAFSGSRSTSRWFFEKILKNDNLLQRILSVNKLNSESPFLGVESLALKTVPKTWKSLRVITPLTLLGLFYSHGIGGVVTERLKEHGLDIQTLQARHRKLVREFSITRSHATADLSRASDSLTKEICNYVLPRPWFNACKRMMTHQLIYHHKGEEKECYTASILPMGNGATFPLETLIFYCVIKAIGELADINGIYSVYGDDLIYPSRLHKYVVSVFPEIGFCLNLDKTHVTSSFRESCGADYSDGVDVRPFFFRGESQNLTRSQYMAVLYKTYNGLCRRWTPYEIRQTLEYLLTEMALTGLKLFRVPPSYPDTAGIHTASPEIIPLDFAQLDWSPIYALFGIRDKNGFPEKGSRWFKFSYLRERSPDRYVTFTEPYYWLTLQHMEMREEEVSILTNPSVPLLGWKEYTKYKHYWKNGKKVKEKETCWKAFVSGKLETHATECTGLVSDWI